MAQLDIFASPLPFTNKQIKAHADVGSTLDEIVTQICPPEIRHAVGAIVTINGHVVVEKHWKNVRPKEGTIINVRIVPQGGGDGGKNPITAILTIAVLIAAPYMGAYFAGVAGVTSAAGIASITAGVAVVGNLLVSAIAPPPKPSNIGSANRNNAAESPTQFIEGARNSASPFGVVPICLGTNRMFPLIAARTFTETQNNDQYVRQLFTWGYGNIVLSDMKIGETPLSQFSDIDIEHRLAGDLNQTTALYSNDVFQEDYSVLLDAASGYVTRTTQSNIDEAIIDLTLPQGLAEFNDMGTRVMRRVLVEVQYSPSGAGTWSPGANSFLSVPATDVPITIVDWANTYVGPNPFVTEIFRKDLVVIDIFTTEVSVVLGQPTADINTAVAPLLPANKVRLSTITVKSTRNPSAPNDAQPTDIVNVTDDRQSALFGTTLSTSSDFFVTKAGIPIGLPNWQIDPIHVHISAGGILAKAFDITAAQTEAIRRSVRIVFPSTGTYDIRLKRLSPDTDSDKIFDQTYLSAIKSIKYQAPVNMVGISGTAIRMRATDQLNGSVDQYNAIVGNAIPDYDVATGLWPVRVTSNPASLYRYILQGPANEMPMADERIDIPALENWHQYCDSKGYTYNRVIDYEASVDDILRDVASAGSASPSNVDGRRSVVVDRPKEDIVQIITPRNSSNYSGEMSYIDMPHAFRVQFRNAAKGYQQDERIVYADGYNESNATKFENLEVQHCTNFDLAWKLARRFLATALLRPEIHTFTLDVENLVSLRGDRIKLVHDVPIIGVGDGRIKQVFDDGTNVTGFSIDDTVTIPSTSTYYTRIRLSDGTQLYKQVNVGIGQHTSFSFSEPFPIIDTPSEGDLAYFVEAGGELDLIITRIEPQNDLSAVVTGLDYAPAIFEAELGEIPAFSSNITTPIEFIRPSSPILISIQSDEQVMVRNSDGSFTPRAIITLRNNNPDNMDVQVKIRRTGSTIFTNANILEANPSRVILTGMDDGSNYDIEIRYRRLGATLLSPPLQINNYKFIGASGIPSDVTGFKINVSGTTSLLTWDASPDIDISHYIIRFSSAFSGATWGTAQILESKVFENRLSLPFQAGTYLIKAVDILGNESANAMAIITYNPSTLENAVAILEEDPAWLGTKDNVITLFPGDTITLEDVTQPGYYYFENPLNLDGLFTSTVSANVLANGAFINNLFEMDDIFAVSDVFGSGNNNLFTEADIFSMDDIFGIGTDGWEVQLQYRLTTTDPADPDTVWSEWSEFNADTLEFWAIEFRLFMQSYEQGVSPQVRKLSVTIDMPDRIERGDDLVVPVEGATITFNPEFQSNPAIAITLQDADANDEIQFISKSVGGFEFMVYNSLSGTYVARTYDFIASGYGRRNS